MVSARHANHTLVDMDGGACQVRFQTTAPSLLRSFPAKVVDAFQVAAEAELGALLHCAASFLGPTLNSWFASELGETHFVTQCWIIGAGDKSTTGGTR